MRGPIGVALRELEEQRATRVDALVKGVSSWDEYLRMQGIIHGLGLAVSALTEALANEGNDDD